MKHRDRRLDYFPTPTHEQFGKAALSVVDAHLRRLQGTPELARFAGDLIDRARLASPTALLSAVEDVNKAAAS